MSNDLNVAINSIASVCFDSIGTEYFVQGFLKSIGEATGSALSTFAKQGLRWEVQSMAAYPAPTELQMSVIPKISEHSHDHPIVQYAKNHPEEIVCCLLTDFVPIEVFRQTDLYREACGPAGLEYMLSASVFDELGNTYTLNLSHPFQNFTHESKEIVKTAYPLFLKAFRIHQLLGQHVDQLQSVLPFSLREAEVLEWVTQGKTNPEIALILDISIKTVEKHLSSVLRKFKFSNRSELIRHTASEDWIRFPCLDAV